MITKKNKKYFAPFIKKNLKYIIPLLIILIGLTVMVFPWYTAWKFDNIQKRAMKIWEEAVLNGEIAQRVDEDAPAPNGNWSVSAAALGEFVNEDGVWEEDTNPEFTLDYLLNNMEGILTIEKINLRSAILKPASKRNLDIAVCIVIDSRKMGEIGNYVLAGHYSRIYGRHLNRVRELGIGDIITLDNGHKNFDYRITEILSVTPSETWVMNDDDAQKLITLITCDYNTQPYNRLIIRGELRQ